MSLASAINSSLEKSAAVVQQSTANRPQLLEDLTRKFAKVQGAEILSVMGMLEDDADDLRDRDRRVRNKLLGAPEKESGDDMTSRSTILADNITIYAGHEPPPPAPTTGEVSVAPPAMRAAQVEQAIAQPVAAPAAPASKGMSTAAKLATAAAIGTALLAGTGGAGAVGYYLANRDDPEPVNFDDRSNTIRFFDPALDSK